MEENVNQLMQDVASIKESLVMVDSMLISMTDTIDSNNANLNSEVDAKLTAFMDGGGVTAEVRDSIDHLKVRVQEIVNFINNFVATADNQL